MSRSAEETGNPKPPKVQEALALGEEMPLEGRLVGIDFGTVRIGLATCDPTQNWVTPYDTYNRRNERLDGQYFCDLAEQERIAGWVIGLPIHCDGKESQKSAEVRSFATWLLSLTGLPIVFFDERFTTAEAKKLLRGTGLSVQKRKKSLDRLAAHLILSHYIECRSGISSQSEPLDDGSDHSVG